MLMVTDLSFLKDLFMTALHYRSNDIESFVRRSLSNSYDYLEPEKETNHSWTFQEEEFNFFAMEKDQIDCVYVLFLFYMNVLNYCD